MISPLETFAMAVLSRLSGPKPPGSYALAGIIDDAEKRGLLVRTDKGWAPAAGVATTRHITVRTRTGRWVELAITGGRLLWAGSTPEPQSARNRIEESHLRRLASDPEPGVREYAEAALKLEPSPI